VILIVPVGRSARCVVIFKLAMDRRAEVAVRGRLYVMLGLVSAAVFGELGAAIGWLGGGGPGHRWACSTSQARMILRKRQTEPVAEGVRLPRGLPRAGARGRGAAVRGDRVRTCCREVEATAPRRQTPPTMLAVLADPGMIVCSTSAPRAPVCWPIFDFGVTARPLTTLQFS